MSKPPIEQVLATLVEYWEAITAHEAQRLESGSRYPGWVIDTPEHARLRAARVELDKLGAALGGADFIFERVAAAYSLNDVVAAWQSLTNISRQSRRGNTKKP
jgi:hypothetical protein